MSSSKLVVQGAAGALGGAGINVEEVFSNTLYEGAGSGGVTVTTGLDIAEEGGIAWIKCRDAANNPIFIDPQRFPDGDHWIYGDLTGVQNISEDVFSFSSTGFSVAGSLTNSDNPRYNGSSRAYVSWNFRRAEKFFDALTYTGTGSATSVSHNLNHDVGMVMIKKTSGSSSSWRVWHRGMGGTNYLTLNTNGASASSTNIFSSAPTSTQINIGASSSVNAFGETYVAYVFAHNDDDGDFGPDGDADIIKCGSYTGNGSDQDIDVGFEPQWLLVRSTSNLRDWYIFDAMRGFGAHSGSDTNNKYLQANENNAEGNFDGISVNATGFSLHGASNLGNNSGETIIYVAIRRGPMAVPEDADDVFAVDGENTSEPYHTSGFPVDMGLKKRTGSTGDWFVMDRLRQGKKLASNSTSAEATENDAMFDYMDGMYAAAAYGQDASYGWMWRRAPNYFDVLAYSGNDTNGRSLSHNLSAEPSMVWIKARNITKEWFVAADFTSSNYKQGYLHLTNALTTTSYSGGVEIASKPTSSAIVLNDLSTVNGSGNDYIAYLFASLDGVSKVGTYTGTGADGNDVDCGFSSGARFVLIKRVNADEWVVFDAERGITSGDDPKLALNSTSAESTNSNRDIDPLNSGFTVNGSDTSMNKSGDTYIFYAIA